MRLPSIIAILLFAGCTSDPLQMLPSDDAGDTSGLKLDSGVAAEDAAAGRDASLDAGFEDAATSGDAGFEDAGTPDGGQMACDLDQPGAADRDRVLVVGQPFSAVVGQDGTEIRSLSLSAGGALVDDGTRLDVGFRPIRIELSINGRFALVLGEDGELASVEITDAQNMAVIDTVTLPSAGYGDLRVWRDGRTIFAVGSNVDTTSGISTVELACDGMLTVRANEFFNVRLAQSLAFLAEDSRAILLGGQTAFEPIDDDDLRLIEYTPGVGWTQIDAFDVWGDFVDALRIAVSPDGSTLVVPNGSPFSNEGHQVSVASISGAQVTETTRLTMNLEDGREALFSTDGRTALVTLLSPGRIAVLADRGNGWEIADTLTGIGLAENMAQITRGALTDRVFVTSVDASGEPNIAVVDVTGHGMASVAGMTNLGSGSENIPVGIAVQP